VIVIGLCSGGMSHYMLLEVSKLDEFLYDIPLVVVVLQIMNCNACLRCFQSSIFSISGSYSEGYDCHSALGRTLLRCHGFMSRDL